jgi:hypothetical protein
MNAPSSGVSLSELIEAARQSRGLLAAETAGYLVLAAADQLINTPRVLDERRCRLLLDGGRVSIPATPPAAPIESERSLRRILRELLQASHGNSPALRALSEASPRGAIDVFIGELESALIPVNRTAATRALARIARETLRLRGGEAELPRFRDAEPSDFGEEAETMPRGVISTPARRPEPSSEIDELLLRAVASTPPPPPPRDYSRGSSFPPGRSSSPAAARGVDELLETFGAGVSRAEDLIAWDALGRSAPAGRAGRSTQSEQDDLAARPDAASDGLPEARARADAAEQASSRAASASIRAFPDENLERRRPVLLWGVLMAALLLVVLLGAILLLRNKPGFLSGRTPDVVEAERRATALAATSHAALPCRATVVVTDVPQSAEVLVRSGIAPIDVDRVPSGTRLEFVATSDGYAPRRAVVPEATAWQSVNGKPRFELAIQLERSRARPGTLDPWPAAEPGTTVGGSGPPGSVHVVTTPRGAEVWMVAGAGPETTISALPCGAGLELLVAGSAGTALGQPFRRRLRVEASELTPEPSASSVTTRVSASP